jgi:hypothetical protein
VGATGVGPCCHGTGAVLAIGIMLTDLIVIILMKIITNENNNKFVYLCY